VRPVDDPDSWMSPAHQQRTCGACHDSVAVVWRGDVHGNPLRLAASDTAQTVICTSCHLGHRMLTRDDPRFGTESVAACASCHEHAGRTFFASYHGKATALGSHITATCAQCHGAHDILPDTAPASRVAAARLVDTCKGCHPYARASFVRYDTHPDVFNRARNPWIFYSFWLMNGLLIFVLVVFGAHTLLWWLRILLDQRRAAASRPEGDA
jgi:nitrate/TMAO reductase-like tetraheme cytochrome c subunit